MLAQSYRRPCGHHNVPLQNGWAVGQFQRNANFITDAKATTYLFLPAAVNRRVASSNLARGANFTFFFNSLHTAMFVVYAPDHKWFDGRSPRSLSRVDAFQIWANLR